jgi:hypothetical protein
MRGARAAYPSPYQTPGQMPDRRTGQGIYTPVQLSQFCPFGQNAELLDEFIEVFFVQPDKTTNLPDKMFVRTDQAKPSKKGFL